MDPGSLIQMTQKNSITAKKINKFTTYHFKPQQLASKHTLPDLTKPEIKSHQMGPDQNSPKSNQKHRSSAKQKQNPQTTSNHTKMHQTTPTST